MKHLLLLLLLVPSLALSQPSAPSDVTPLELRLRDRCVTLLKERWPVGTSITATLFERRAGGATVWVNQRKGVPAGTARFAGSCDVEDDAIVAADYYDLRPGGRTYQWVVEQGRWTAN